MNLNAKQMMQTFKGDMFGLGMLAGLAQAYGAGMAPLGPVWVFEPQMTAFVLAKGKIGFVLSRRLVVANGGYAWSSLFSLTMRGPDLSRSSSKTKKR
jgi:hypothetical protein